MVTNADYMDEMASSPDYSEQATLEPGVNPAPVKVTFNLKGHIVLNPKTI